MGQSVVMKTKTVALTPGAGASGSTRRPSRSGMRSGPADAGRPIITIASTTQTVRALARDILQPSTEANASISVGRCQVDEAGDAHEDAGLLREERKWHGEARVRNEPVPRRLRRSLGVCAEPHALPPLHRRGAGAGRQCLRSPDV